VLKMFGRSWEERGQENWSRSENRRRGGEVGLSPETGRGGGWAEEQTSHVRTCHYVLRIIDREDGMEMFDSSKRACLLHPQIQYIRYVCDVH
jgi:hypothetical protein